MQRFEKFKEHFIWKRKKEILLYIGILVVVLGTIKVTEAMVDQKYLETTGTVQAQWVPNSYRVFVDGKDFGLVASREDAEVAVKQALQNLITELGYDPEVTPEIRYYEEYSKDESFTTLSALVPSMQQVLKEGIDVLKVKAYAMKIGDDFVVALNSEEDILKVLQNAQDVYVSSDAQFAVTLEENPYNGLVESPNIVAMQDTLDKNRSFKTNGDGVSIDTSVTENTDPSHQGKTVDVEFTQEVMVVETFVDASEILTVEAATELITKENQEPKKYVVKSGDSASVIASNNDMDLQTLYNLNAGLDENTVLQIGDELIVMVPEPELSVTTTEEVVYPVAIPKGTTYTENSSKYAGSNTTIDNGSDGVKQLTATITKLNGKETNRVILKEEVITEPVNQIIEKGSKPLPAKGATGNYIYPVINYTLSSSFGYRWGDFHEGTDFAAPTGTSIRAADGGVVISAGWSGSYGMLVVINHGNGVTTRYGHCSKILVSVGQQISQYQEIAKVGNTGYSTGPHLHFEIRFDGTAANPMKYLSH